MKRTLVAALAFFACLPAAEAKEWQVDYGKSSLGFMGEQGTDKFLGGFKKFTAQISLDPEHPETGKIVVTIDTSSAYAGSSERDEMLPQPDWFNTAKFPQAQFVSTSIRKTDADHYVAEATLTIKGQAHNVVLPFTLDPEGDHWRAKGRINLMRNDFSVGQGTFSGEAYVKHAVDVGIDIIAK